MYNKYSVVACAYIILSGGITEIDACQGLMMTELCVGLRVST